MKLDQLSIVEARKERWAGDLGMLQDAHAELGIDFKWPKITMSNEILHNAIAMMKSAKGHESMGQLSSPSYPLHKLGDAFKKLQDSALYDIHSSLKQLEGLQGFMAPEHITKIRDAAVTLSIRKREMEEYALALNGAMRAVMEIYTVANRATDPYRKSIAVAVMKKLGIDV